MRAKTRIIPLKKSVLARSSTALAAGSLCILAATGGSALAQSSPGSFTLPSPTPTPTPAPQGPVDIRDGVIIGPRTIPQGQPQVSQPPAPSPSPTPTATAEAPAAAGAAPQTQPGAPTPTEPPRSSVSETSRPDQAIPARGTASSSTAESGANTGIPAPQNALPLPPSEPVANESKSALDLDQDIAPAGTETGYSPAIQPSDSQAWNAIRLWPWIAALLAVFAGLGWWIWQRRRVAPTDAGMSAPNFAAGVRIAIPQSSDDLEPALTDNEEGSAQTKTDRPLEPVASVAPNLASVDKTPPAANMALQLEVTAASRSLMAFSVEYRLDIANRSDHALRDLSISARLVCARSGGHAQPAPDEPLQLIERIGPHQSRSVSGQVQLPLSAISPMRQGSTPLFVPLLQVTVQAAGYPPTAHSYVIGSPSASSATRLHPIPLDTLPGGIPGLRAQRIKDAPQPEPA